MKILHVITTLEVGGAQRLLSDLLPLLAEVADISLLVYERVNTKLEKKVREGGVRLISLDEPNFYDPRVLFRMRKIFREYDIVHAHLFPTIYWASLAARGLRVRLIYTEHSTMNSRRNKWFFRPIECFMYSRYDKIISISQKTQEALTAWLCSNNNRFITINNGIDTFYFASVKVPVIPKSLIMVSRFASAKDQETVIRAMVMIDPMATLRFVGDGESRSYCEEVACEVGVVDRVQFLGTRFDVAELIASSMIGIQSSIWEGFGLTAVEIMSCGKPIIGTNVDGLKQVIEGAGEMFSVGNANELAERVNILLNDHSYYESVSARCKERAKMFDIRIMVEKYTNVYYQILK